MKEVSIYRYSEKRSSTVNEKVSIYRYSEKRPSTVNERGLHLPLQREKTLNGK